MTVSKFMDSEKVFPKPLIVQRSLLEGLAE